MAKDVHRVVDEYALWTFFVFEDAVYTENFELSGEQGIA
jgi:hypothetical protein